MKKNLNTIIFCSLCLTFTSCYQFFQSKIPMNSESSSTKLSDIFLEETPVTSLNAPEQIFVSEYLYTDRIKISWTPVEGASSYRLERAVKSQQDNTIPSEEDFKTIPASKLNVVSSSFIYDTSFIDIILDSPSYISSEYGNVYYYRVRAENSSKGYEPSSFIISQNGAALFAPCTTITASAGESTEEIKIEWKKTLNASMYKIYRSRNSQGSNSELLAKVKANITSYTDFITEADQGTDFYYSIEAENFLGNTSVISPLALGYTLVKGAPTRVTGVITTEGKSRGDTNNSITIQWNKVEFDTDNYNGFYSIYRSSSTDPSLTLVKSVPSTDAETETFTNDKGLKPNTYYYYRVMAYAEKIEKDSDESKNLIKGPISNSSAEDFDPETKKTAACEGFIISAPPFVAVNNLGDLNEITFSAPIGEKGYSEDSGLYDDYKNFTYKIFAGNETDNVTTELSAVPSEAENGMYTVTVEKYKYYKIQTASEDGSLTSGFSSIVAQSPSCVTNVIATRAANPADWEINTPNSNEIYPVKITWAGPAEGADGGFHIYRSTSPDSGFRKITEEPVTGFEYIDKNESAKAGSYYYYKVLSLNILGSGSNYSETVMGYGALTYNQYMREYNKTIKQSQKKLTLMYKSPDTAKLGTETIQGDISGTLYYNAGMNGLTDARIIMTYTDYADLRVPCDDTKIYFLISGDTNTSANMQAAGKMDGIVTCSEEGMYPGTVDYNNVKIVGGAAGGGYYVITPKNFPSGNVDYTVGNE